MNRIFFALTFLFVISGCGVKQKSTGGTPPEPLKNGGNLPENVFYTEAKKFLIHHPESTFKVGTASRSYRLRTQTLQSLEQEKHSYRIKYWMPEMPEMPVTPAKVTLKNSSEIEVVYDISMEGLWEFILEIVVGDKVEDNYRYRMTVKE